MRKILFRGKGKNTKQWVYGYFVKAEMFDKSGFEYLIIEEKANGSSHNVIPESVCEFTGLTDKNGTKIFEGDILKYDDTVHNGEVQIEGSVYNVEFYQGVFIAGSVFSTNWFMTNSTQKYTVIGNIHDNLELLEVSEK